MLSGVLIVSCACRFVVSPGRRGAYVQAAASRPTLHLLGYKHNDMQILFWRKTVTLNTVIPIDQGIDLLSALF